MESHGHNILSNDSLISQHISMLLHICYTKEDCRTPVLRPGCEYFFVNVTLTYITNKVIPHLRHNDRIMKCT